MRDSAVIRYPAPRRLSARQWADRYRGGDRQLGPPARCALKLGVVLAAYYAAAQLGYLLHFAGPVAAFVWLPAGVGIALLYLLGPQFWPAVLVADLLVNNYMTLPVGSAFGQSFGNVLEVVLAAVLLRRIAARHALLGSVTGLCNMVAAFMLATALCATIGMASVLTGGTVPLASAPRLALTWWLGDFGGVLIVVPLAIAWFSSARPSRPHRRTIESVSLAVALLGLITVAWRADVPLYWTLFALFWAAFRFGPRGASLAIAVGAAFTIWTTSHYLGRFAYLAADHRLLDVQVYLVLSAVAALAVAVLVEERRQLDATLSAVRARVVAAADEERQRIAHNIHDGAQQRLVSVAVHLSLAADETRIDPVSAPAAFQRAAIELELAIDELRDLAHGVRPPALNRVGLAAAIRQAAARSAIPIEVDLEQLRGERLGERVENTAYYVVLEAITNAQRYAHASIVRIRALLNSGDLVLEIADDGVGGASEQDGLGLRGLRDRVEAVGGEFVVESRPGGTLVAARIPLAAESTGRVSRGRGPHSQRGTSGPP